MIQRKAPPMIEYFCHSGQGIFFLCALLGFFFAVLIDGGAAPKHAAATRAVPTQPTLCDTLHLSHRKLCENLIIFGQSGSGKTTMMAVLFKPLLPHGGWTFMTVKPDAPFDYVKMCVAAGRKDVKIFSVGESAFNIVNYVLTRKWGSPEQLADIIEKLDEQQSRNNGSKEDGFWRTNRRETAIHCINACVGAFGTNISFAHLQRFLSHAPATLEAMVDPTWNKSFCRRVLKRAGRHANTPEKRRAIVAAHTFFTKTQPMAGHKVVGATTTHLAALIANFTRGKLYETTCRKSTHTPDWDLEGHITIFADTTLEGLANQFLQLAYCQCLIREGLVRPVTDDTPICTIVQDEYTECCAPAYDASTMLQTRSQRIARVIAVQGMSPLLNVMSDGIKAKFQAQSIVGNCATKIFLASTDSETGEMFEKYSGKAKVRLSGGGQTPGLPNEIDVIGVGGGFNMNFHEQFMPRKFASALMKLRTGGPPDFIISGYVHQSGGNFDGLPFKKFEVRQDV